MQKTIELAHKNKKEAHIQSAICVIWSSIDMALKMNNHKNYKYEDCAVVGVSFVCVLNRIYRVYQFDCSISSNEQHTGNTIKWQMQIGRTSTPPTMNLNCCPKQTEFNNLICTMGHDCRPQTVSSHKTLLVSQTNRLNAHCTTVYYRLHTIDNMVKCKTILNGFVNRNKKKPHVNLNAC